MNGQLDIISLILHASLPVKLVLVLLLFFSFFSWVIMFRKFAMFKRVTKEVDAFEERFWSGGDLTALFRDVDARGDGASGLESIFKSGFREFVRQRKKTPQGSPHMTEGVARAMRTVGTKEVVNMERHLQFLANVGSISPYIGLFGTVWGIMVAFQGLSAVKEATIAMVAPGISEALIATAMGLFAAIPAVWAYNRCVSEVDNIATRYDTFQEEFASILEHHANTGMDV